MYTEVRGQLVPRTRSIFYQLDAGNTTSVFHLGSRCLYILSLFAGLKVSWFFLFVCLFVFGFVCFKTYLFIHVWVFCLHGCGVPCVCRTSRGQTAVSSEPGVTGTCEPPCGCWESNRVSKGEASAINC